MNDTIIQYKKTSHRHTSLDSRRPPHIRVWRHLFYGSRSRPPLQLLATTRTVPSLPRSTERISSLSIISVKYCLPVPVFHFWPKPTHPAAWSLCDSLASNCFLHYRSYFCFRMCYAKLVFSQLFGARETPAYHLGHTGAFAEIDWPNINSNKTKVTSVEHRLVYLENVAIGNALQLEAARATPALCRFNYDAMPSLMSPNFQPIHWALLLLIHYFTMWPWPLTLNFCSVSPVTWNSVPYLNAVEQSAAELLRLQCLTLTLIANISSTDSTNN